VSKRKLTEEMLEEAANLREKGWSLGRLANRYGCSEGAIAWHMLRLGADVPRLATKELEQTYTGPMETTRGGFVVRRFSPADDALIRKLDAEGKGTSAIGRAFDPLRLPNSIRGRLMTLARHDARREAAQDAAFEARRAPAPAARP